MSVDRETTRRVAHLARIRVEEDQLDHLSTELSRILAFAEQLGEVDVTGVEPMTSVTPMKLKMRVDAVTDGNRRDDVLANAPDAREGFFVAPKVVD
jgi:aspartyl-tRNA(Asn)/glutamyl-tRNA(Gln) amidotransferase subunit C